MRYTFTAPMSHALSEANSHAGRRGESRIRPLHILLSLLELNDSEIIELLRALGIERLRLQRAVAGSLPPAGAEETGIGDLPYASGAKDLLQLAIAEARAEDSGHLTPRYLFLAILRRESRACTLLEGFGITYDAVQAASGRGRTRDKEDEVEQRPWFTDIDPSNSTPLYEQIIRTVEEAVATGRLPAGERLPTVRALAKELGIAPGTVGRAYTELENRGVVKADGSRGTRVAPRNSRSLPPDERAETLDAILRPAAVAAFHQGAKAQEVRNALERAMRGIYYS